jgi:hypothetical protein
MAFGGRLHLPSFPKVRRKIPSWSSYTRNTGALKRSRILIRKRRKKRTKIPETKWLDEASFSDSCIPGPLELAQLVMNTRRKRGEMETTPIGRGDDAFLHSYHKVAGRSLASFCVSHLHNRKEYIAHLVGCYVSSLFQGLFFTCVCVCVFWVSIVRKSFTRRFAILVHFLSSVLMIVQPGNAETSSLAVTNILAFSFCSIEIFKKT